MSNFVHYCKTIKGDHFGATYMSFFTDKIAEIADKYPFYILSGIPCLYKKSAKTVAGFIRSESVGQIFRSEKIRSETKIFAAEFLHAVICMPENILRSRAFG